MLACRLVWVKKCHCRDDLHRMSVKCMMLLHSYVYAVFSSRFPSLLVVLWLTFHCSG